MAQKTFFFKDKSGRGYSGTLTFSELKKNENSKDTTNWDGTTLYDWIKEAEQGDTWENNSERYTCTAVKKSEPRQTMAGKIIKRHTKKRDKLTALTARKYIDLYDKDGQLTPPKTAINEERIDKFLADLKEEIIQQLQ